MKNLDWKETCEHLSVKVESCGGEGKEEHCLSLYLKTLMVLKGESEWKPDKPHSLDNILESHIDCSFSQKSL